MRLQNKAILRFDFQRLMKRRDIMLELLAVAHNEAERLEAELARCDAEITEISNEFDSIVDCEEDPGAHLTMR